jgi:hypothetical protein
MPDGSGPSAPTTLRMRDPGPVTIPFTVDMAINEQISLMQLRQAIGAFNFQLPSTKLTLGQPASRLQANGMINLLEQYLPTQGDSIADVVIRTAVPKWLGDNGLQLKPEIEGNITLLTFDGLQLSIYGQAKFTFVSGKPELSGEFVTGVQIRLQGKASKKQVRRKQ